MTEQSTNPFTLVLTINTSYEVVAKLQRAHDMQAFMGWLNEPHVTANDALREDFKQLIKNIEQTA